MLAGVWKPLATGVRADSVGRGGDSKSDFERSLVEHRPALLAVAARICRNAADAEDLVQETLVRALDHAASYQPGTRLRSWLVSVLLNLFRDRCRSERRRPLHTVLEEAELAAPEPEPSPRWTEIGPTELRAALARLDEDARAVFELHELEGRSYIEIAATLRIANATVGSRLSRTRQKLKELLSPARPQEGDQK